MCFKSKVKTPKTNPDAIKAPEPVLIEEPKGVDFGATEDESTEDTGIDSVKVEKDKGDGSSAVDTSGTNTGTVKKSKTNSAVKRAMKR